MIAISSTDCKWYSYALSVADQSSHPHHKMGAVIIKGGALLGFASNNGLWGRHAERRAIRPHASYEGAVIYIARKKGGCSFPCESCYQLIKKAGIKTIVFVDKNLALTKVRV